MGGRTVHVELVRLSVHGGVLRWRAEATVLPSGRHPDDLAREAARTDLERATPGAVLHSTSWRMQGEGLVLTYALFPAVAADGDGAGELLAQHVVAGPDAVHPSPVQVGAAHVATHAARHLHDLAERDPNVRRCAEQDGGAWAVLARHAALVHVHEPGRLVLHDANAVDTVEDVSQLSELCAIADGHAPFDEHTLLSLDGPRQLTHGRIELRLDGRLVGCAVLTESAKAWSVEAALLPALRGQGWGRALLDAARRHVVSHGGGTVTAWTHGDAPAAAALGRAWGASTSRRLDVLRRPLVDLPASPAVAPTLGEGAVLRHLDPTSEADRDAWLVLSNAAFTGHPDNGGWSRRDLDWRAAAAWTDASRWPVVSDGQRLLAGVWTKREPGSGTGELYVVAVAPTAQGRGLGRVVVEHALRDLADAGCTVAELYVEAENAVAQRLYRSCGFEPGAQHRCLVAVVPDDPVARALEAARGGSSPVGTAVTGAARPQR